MHTQGYYKTQSSINGPPLPKISRWWRKKMNRLPAYIFLAAGDARNPTANRIVINAAPSELPTVNQMRLLPFVRILFIPPGCYCRRGRRPLLSSNRRVCACVCARAQFIRTNVLLLYVYKSSLVFLNTRTKYDNKHRRSSRVRGEWIHYKTLLLLLLLYFIVRDVTFLRLAAVRL